MTALATQQPRAIEPWDCLPVVATNVDGSKDLVEDGRTGFLVDVDDDSSMALRICELAADADKRRRMGALGRQRIRECFNIEANIGRMEVIYAALSSRQAGKVRPPLDGAEASCSGGRTTGFGRR